MAYTSGDIADLEEAIRTGARRVRYSDGSEVEYRSLSEMRSILADMKAQVANAKPVRAFLGVVKSGY